ncbi:MAG: hypothetical protein ACE37J_21170 [Pikeienuella sp.]|uniref:hypothetical protein n=1 Tax=Pikeienuella sp. TaxID=2831957 RepID=UPI0039193903
MPFPGAEIRPRWRSVLAGAALASFAVGAAKADGWTISGALSQRFGADSNLTLSQGGDDPTFSSTTTGNLAISSETPRTSLSFSPGFRATRFIGEGGQNQITPSFSGGLSHRVGSLDLSSGLSLDIRPTVFSELEELDDGSTDLDVIQRNATAISLRASAGAGYRIDSRNRFNLGTNLSIRRFTDDADTLTPSTTIGASGGFAHSITDRTTVNLSTGLSRVTFGGTNDSESVTASFGGGVSTSINPGFTFGGQVGLNYTETTRPGDNDSSRVGFSFSTSAGYAVNEATSLSFSAGQSLQASATGELQDRLRVNLGLGHSINTRENFSLSLGLSRQSLASTLVGGGSGSTLVQTSVGYQFAITPELNAGLNYSLRLQPEESLDSASHRLFFTISKAFTLQP